MVKSLCYFCLNTTFWCVIIKIHGDISVGWHVPPLQIITSISLQEIIKSKKFMKRYKAPQQTGESNQTRGIPVNNTQ